VLPEEQELVSEVQRLLVTCKSNFADPAVTETQVAVKLVAKKNKRAPQQDGSNAAQQDESDDSN
jgi:hypothetical protein